MGLTDTNKVRRLLESYLQEIGPDKTRWHGTKTKEYAAGRAILEASDTDKIGVLFAALSLPIMQNLLLKIFVIQPLVQDLLRQRIAFTEANLTELCQTVVKHSLSDFDFSTKKWLVHHLEEAVSMLGLTETLKQGAMLLEESLQKDSLTAPVHALSVRISILLHGPKEAFLYTEEAWGVAVLADWEALSGPDQKNLWRDLLIHALSSDASKPTTKWLKEARAKVEALGLQEAQAQISHWLEFYCNTALPQIEPTGDGGEDYYAQQRLMSLANHNFQAVKGLVWLCRLFDDAQMASLLGNVALHSLKKIPNHGPKSAKVGTACILTLASMTGSAPVTQLGRLKTRVTYQTAQGTLDKALNEAASRSGLTRRDLEELTVPGFGIDAQGCQSEQFGEYTATLAVTAAGNVEMTWKAADGKTLKAAPVSLKRDHAQELKALKKSATELQEALQTQRDRLEDLMRGAHTWPLDIWRERYLAHPLLGLLARRLIWRFGTQTGVVRGGQIEDEMGQPITGLAGDTSVHLWHPITSKPECVFAWRSRLEQLLITQPFKQAHRELYLITDAERATRLYSNRFAAHILKQHQFSALCRQRGWQYTLQGGWDSYNEPTLQSSSLGFGATFTVDGVTGENALSPSGVYLYVTTEGVAFFPPDGEQTPLPLDQIPPLVLSEVMRDVDLFVGVASVGNDPTWADGGPEGRYRDYWRDYAFGDLGETAKTRAAVLAKLLPRLQIAGRCRLDGKFLVVRGDLRTYKIHLGSGNILMEPNDQYLCIVPGRSDEGGGSDLFLPFEGDRMLAIILSKALLLANDKAIQDLTIVSQIKRGG